VFIVCVYAHKRRTYAVFALVRPTCVYHMGPWVQWPMGQGWADGRAGGRDGRTGGRTGGRAGGRVGGRTGGRVSGKTLKNEKTKRRAKAFPTKSRA